MTSNNLQTNSELDMAWRCIEHTGTHLFLTGKAGTGKTTFLRQLRERSPKRMVVLAPTGIAAINAGGVTIHSFFQLPFAPYLPGAEYSLSQQYKLRREKIDIIRSMDLLVIDEISMVRADLLDLVDVVLRRYRDHQKAFGGVQLLMIGDLQQLSPVLKEQERQLLATCYDTPFFFGSHALQKTSYLTIELQQVFRQKEAYFINLLNALRENRLDSTFFEAINKRYIPDFQHKETDDYIRLMTHNVQAQQVNDAHLARIDAPAFSYSSNIKGIFPESAYPAETNLTLKEGAQVMFIKNDVSGEQRYFNGKIGQVTLLDEDVIEVLCADSDKPVRVERGEWTNCRYVLDEESKEIYEAIDGTFEQYPLRLAWAITIHKSQGLTFDRAIIDASASFAHGQVYVALSRCRTLDGVVLSAPLDRQSIHRDIGVDTFTRQSLSTTPNPTKIAHLEEKYYLELLNEQFNFVTLGNLLYRLKESANDFLMAIYPEKIEQLHTLIEQYSTEVISVAETFYNVYNRLFCQTTDYKNNVQLQERVCSAANYFADKLQTLLLPVAATYNLEIDNKEHHKLWTNLLQHFTEELRIKLVTLNQLPKTGFSVTDYLKLKSKALIEKSDTERQAPSKKLKKEQKSSIIEGDDALNQELFEHLRAWRKELAKELRVPAYTILHQKALIAIAREQPRTTKELLAVPHVGVRTIEKYGGQLLDIVTEFV